MTKVQGEPSLIQLFETFAVPSSMKISSGKLFHKIELYRFNVPPFTQKAPPESGDTLSTAVIFIASVVQLVIPQAAPEPN